MANQILIDEIRKKYRTVQAGTDEFYIATDYELKFGDYLTVYVMEKDDKLFLYDCCQVSNVFNDALKKPKVTDLLQKNNIEFNFSCLMQTCTEMKQVDTFVKVLKTVIKLCNKEKQNNFS